ncbi:MAG: patatin-like phospholipase family protein [Anaerolineae bacterium]
MIAFVLSGGSNQGALQVGALRALVECGIRPEIVVGSSVGSLNAVQIANAPNLAGVEALEDIWRTVHRRRVYPNGLLSVLWRVLRREKSLFPQEPYARFLLDCAPSGKRYFRQVFGAQLYIVATDMMSGRPYVFGQDRGEDMLTAVLASTAIPPVWAPVSYANRLFADGGIAANLPLRIAWEQGARTIYALHISGEPPRPAGLKGVFGPARWALSQLVEQQTQAELAWARGQPGLTVHYLRLTALANLPFYDFSQGLRLMAAGYEMAQTYLFRRELARQGRVFRQKTNPLPPLQLEPRLSGV